jgi:hypothetical protein
LRSGRGVCEARLLLETRWAEALVDSLEPDNTQAPRGLEVRCWPRGGLVECVVRLECSEPRGLLTLRNTIDDLLATAKAALESLESASGTSVEGEA